MQTYYTWMDSPTGKLLLTASESGVTQLAFAAGRCPPVLDPAWRADEAPLREAIRQVTAFFAGELRDFDLPLAPAGTAFRQKVWAALRQIPYGETVGYGELAARIGNPAASRAVGLANGANPISIIIPCHRVIGSNGKLVGYGGGLDNKRWLLEFEAERLVAVSQHLDGRRRALAPLQGSLHLAEIQIEHGSQIEGD